MNTSGILYIVATPIGNLADFSARATAVLREVDLIVAEDTRHSRRLLDHFAIPTKMLSLHEHNEQQRVSQLLDLLQQGKAIALISDAGTPLISDPGYHLVRSVREQGIKVVPVPGACALIAALSAAGLPSDRFMFEGFLPAQQTARTKHLRSLQHEMRTVIFYEAPHRIVALVQDMLTVFGEQRYVVLARELTKTFETIHGDSLVELLKWLQADPNQQKGEFVVLLRGAEKAQDQTMQAQRVLEILLAELPVKQAARLAAEITGEKKNLLYKQALASK